MVASKLRGISALNLDNKGRMAVPTKYRQGLAQLCEGQMVLTVADHDHCLWLYPLPEWEDIERRLVKLPSLHKQTLRLKRLLIGHATEVELDASGRILLPTELRQFASLDKSAMLVGVGNKFEIWNEADWTTRCSEWLAEKGDDEHLPPELASLTL
jgi:MraZ protein